MMKQKVLFFINSYAGGAEKMSLNISSFLCNEEFDVKYCIVGKDEGLIKKFIPEGRNVSLIKVKSFTDFLLFKLIKILLKEKPAIVFTSLMPLNWRLCLASVFSPKTKVIIRINNYLYTQSLVQKIRLFIAYQFANKLIVQTDEMKEEHIEILKIKPSKIITLANPVNTEVIDKKIYNGINPFNKDKINYVFVGRIHKVKGLDTLISSFAIVLKQHKNAMLHIVGETGGIFQDYYHALIKQISDLGISSNINFAGFSNNPYLYMKYANCFVLPSRNEGLPNVIIESMYLGTPVAVTCSVPVIKRIVREGIDGYVVEVDDINSLANAMLKALKLDRVISSYQSASKEDFVRLFKY